MTSEDFIEIIDEIGKRLEGPAKAVFDLAVRQVYVELFVCLAVFIPLTIIFILSARACHKRGWDILDMNFEVMFVGVGICGIGSAISFGFAISAIAGALNPQWRAIQLLARQVGVGS